MRLINKLLYVLVAAVPIAALAGCSSSGSSVATGAPPEVSSIVIDTVPTADAAGIYIAKEKGFFAKQGLKVTLVPVGGGELGMGDIQSGKAQLLEGNYVSFILAQVHRSFAAPTPTNPTAKGVPAKPIDLRIIANSSQMQPGNQLLFVMPGSPYTSVAQLAKSHAVVGVNTLHNIGSVLLGSLLTANGYSLGSINQKAEFLPDMPKLLAEHKVPAAWMPEPFATVAEQQYGAIPIADFDQGSLENFPIGTIVGGSKWVQAHPKTVAAFLRAYDAGQEIADTNRTAVEQAMLHNHVTSSQRVASTMTLDTYPLAMDVPVMQRVADSMYEFHLISKPYNILNMIQPEPGMIRK